MLWSINDLFVNVPMTGTAEAYEGRTYWEKKIKIFFLQVMADMYLKGRQIMEVGKKKKVIYNIPIFSCGRKEDKA